MSDSNRARTDKRAETRPDAEVDGPQVSAVVDYLQDLQDRICTALLAEESHAHFVPDRWQRAEGGGGDTRVLADGDVFERAGVNFSLIHGDQLPAAASARRPELAGRGFRVCGVSVVVHPRNPYVPTAHFNLRFFIAEKPGEPTVWWFGGGFDLTPYYPFTEDVVHWHATAARACADYGEAVYPQFKRNCDEYFYLPHRGEARGVGGLFFDDLNEWGFADCFGFARSVGQAFIDAYAPIVARRRHQPYGERERDFQLYRRGRYVEFNLVYDRGTLFGLQSKGRTESILMSMPPRAAGRYDWQAEPGSNEARLQNEFLQPRDWLDASSS